MRIGSLGRARQPPAAVWQAQREMQAEDPAPVLTMAANPLLLELRRTLDRNQQIP